MAMFRKVDGAFVCIRERHLILGSRGVELGAGGVGELQGFGWLGDGWRSFFGFGHRFEEEGLLQDGFEKVFGGGQASCDFGSVEEAGDAEDDGLGGFFAAKTDGAFEAGFSEGAREAQDAR